MENTGLDIVCPKCKKVLDTYDFTGDLELLTESYCDFCDVDIVVEHSVDINFSTYLKEI